MVGHVKGGEAGVGVAEHGFNGVISVDSAPTPTRLPHSVENPAYFQGIVPALQRDSLGLDTSIASNRVGVKFA